MIMAKGMMMLLLPSQILEISIMAPSLHTVIQHCALLLQSLRLFIIERPTMHTLQANTFKNDV